MFNICLAFDMKLFACEMGLFKKKNMTHKLSQNANFENGGTTIQVSRLHVLLNILSISSLPRVHDTSVNSRYTKSSHVILRFEEN